MIVSEGENVHVITRRLFESEARRHFMGEVMAASGSVVRLQGRVVVFDTSKNQYVRKPELRTTVIDLAESGYIVNILPPNVDIDSLQYTHNSDRRLVVTDGKGFTLDINEFGSMR